MITMYWARNWLGEPVLVYGTYGPHRVRYVRPLANGKFYRFSGYNSDMQTM